MTEEHSNQEVPVNPRDVWHSDIFSIDEEVNEALGDLDLVNQLDNDDLVALERRLNFLHDRLGLVWKCFAMARKEREVDGRIKQRKDPMQSLMSNLAESMADHHNREAQRRDALDSDEVL